MAAFILVSQVGNITENFLRSYGPLTCPNLLNFCLVNLSVIICIGDISIILKFWGYIDMKFCIPPEAFPSPSTS